MPDFDVPSFLRNTEEPTSDENPVSALTDDPVEAPTETPTEEENPTETTEETPEENKDEIDSLVDTEEEETEEQPTEIIEETPSEKPVEEKPTEEVVAEEEHPAAQLSSVSEQVAQKMEKLTEGLNKYQTVLTKNKVIDYQLPKIADYGNEDGTLDVERYMTDAFDGLVMSVQKAFAGGPMAAMIYGTLHQALLQDHLSNTRQTEGDKRARSMESKIVQDFPIFGKNEKLAKMFGLYASKSWAEKVEEAKTKGEKVGQPDYTFLNNAAKDFLETMNIDVKEAQKPDPAEKPKGGPSITEPKVKYTGKDADIMSDIDDMMNLKNKKSIF